MLKFNFRNGPASPAQTLRDRVEALLEAHAVDDYQLDWGVHAHPFLSDPGPLRETVAQAVQNRFRRSPEFNTGGGTSDARFIAPLGTEVLELGPINQSIHKVDENVSIDDLASLSEVYFDILRRISG